MLVVDNGQGGTLHVRGLSALNIKFYGGINEIGGNRILVEEVTRSFGRIESDLIGKLREIYRCVVCEAAAVRAGDSVICTADISHIFPLDYY